MRTLIVKKVDNQGDRVLLYGERDDYYVIGSAKCTAKVGDEITYEPYGWNFGWLKEN